MKKVTLLLATIAALIASGAYAQDGNNGNGQGGCGVGQQTNGCGVQIPGPQGPQGEKGDKGDKGDTGATGNTGATGAAGQNGQAGANGRDGKNGATGTAGKDGATGKQGIQGIAGRDAQDVSHRAYAGNAAAMAIATLPQPTLPGRSMVALGAGTFRGETGYALGISHVTSGNQFVLKGAVTGDSRGGFGAAIGAGFQF